MGNCGPPRRTSWRCHLVGWACGAQAMVTRASQLTTALDHANVDGRAPPRPVHLKTSLDDRPSRRCHRGRAAAEGDVHNTRALRSS